MATTMSQEQMRAAAAELDQALYMHEQWAEDIYAALVCRVQPDARDVGSEAYRQCRFGQWYYAKGRATLADHPGFAEVEAEHRRMHQSAASLLRASMNGTPISLEDHQRFVSAMKRMRLEIQSLKREIEVSLYNIDALTGVPGRLEMLTRLREQRELVMRAVHPCCVAMFDIDRFKSINDTHGHPTGDRVLIAIARYIQAHLRPYDMIFRYGGEEFLLCLPDADIEVGREICDRLRAEMATLAHHDNGGPPFQVTLSVGVAALEADISVEDAIDRADRALLAAKAAGRNCTIVWEPSLSQNQATEGR